MTDVQFRDDAVSVSEFPPVYRMLRGMLLNLSSPVDVGSWHAMDISGKPELVSHELEAVNFHINMPQTTDEAQSVIQPNLPWAENQFQERISGTPLNPGETYKEWPWQSKMDQHVDPVFSHTYMERYWPKHAGRAQDSEGAPFTLEGIRFDYGDLSDLLDLLASKPFTRQAILPVWFPEDTGAVHGGRVPCSLHYQFLLRNGLLHCSYAIRSCDFIRHFRDDIYLTVRLVQWVLDQLQIPEEPMEERYATPEEELWSKAKVGILSVSIGSLHIFTGDIKKLEVEMFEDV